MWVVFRECDTCDRLFEPTSAGIGACPQCTEIEDTVGKVPGRIDDIVQEANAAIQERINYYDEQLDLIRDAIDDDLDLAREHIAEAGSKPKLRRGQEDPRFLDVKDYLAF